jgi:hypothetical protein
MTGRHQMRTLMMIAMPILSVPCAEGHDIYSGLMDHLGQSSCCDEKDCRPAHYRATSAGVEMLLDDEWVRVPAASRIGNSRIRFQVSSIRQL